MSGPIDVELVLADELNRLGVGAGRVSRQLPTRAFETGLEVRVDAAVAAAAFAGAISRLGRLLGSRSDGPDPVVAGVVGGGFLSLNPAVIEVRFASLGAGRCRATVIGVAKEGMIKQATAEKAVHRLLGAPEVVDLQGWNIEDRRRTRSRGPEPIAGRSNATYLEMTRGRTGSACERLPSTHGAAGWCGRFRDRPTGSSPTPRRTWVPFAGSTSEAEPAIARSYRSLVFHRS